MAALSLCAPAVAQEPPYAVPAPTYQSVTREAYIPMDDGVDLAATLAFPSTDGANPAPGPFPVILTMTPYSKDSPLSGPSAALVTRGYVHAVVDIRGAGASGGNLDGNYFSPREQRDGHELVEWLGTQPWSTGNVGMNGGSYLGITQYLTAGTQPPHLKAIVPSMALGDLYRDATYHGGMLSQFFGAQYLVVQGGPGLLSGPQEANDRERAFAAKLDQAQSDPIAFDYLGNTTYTDFYRDRSPVEVADRIQVPTLIYDGWFDGFIRGATEMYGLLSARPGVETRLWIDPVPHKGTRSNHFNPQGYPGSALDSFVAAEIEFFERHLKGRLTPDRDPVKLFLMGRDQYVRGASFPPAGTDYRRLYLRPGGLSDAAPSAGEESYFTNPADGVTNTLSRHGNVAASAYLPLDQSLERRQGLVWETEPMTERLSVVGPIALDLEAASTAPDTDWVVRISDVAPDGSAKLLTEGYLRASHRALDPARSRPERPFHTHVDPQPVEPGRFYDYSIEVWATGADFEPGHRMRVQLTSNDTPNHTPGSIVLSDDATRFELEPHQPALNTVRYGKSSLLVPVLP